jgi:hypothetical protein
MNVQQVNCLIVANAVLEWLSGCPQPLLSFKLHKEFLKVGCSRLIVRDACDSYFILHIFTSQVSEVMDVNPGSEVHVLHRLVGRLPRFVDNFRRVVRFCFK